MLFDMDIAARTVAEMPVEHARRFRLMGDGAEVRAQIESLLSHFPWMTHIILQPNMPGPAFLNALRHGNHPLVLIHR